MPEPSTHINYSFEDIQRYLQGKMSASEMHDIEKAALQDSFLADAIEGFAEADLNTAKQHLNEINASLTGEKKESKVVAFNRKTQWLNIAALVIILAGIGIVASYFFKSSNQTTQVAQAKNDNANSFLSGDSVANKADTVAANTAINPSFKQSPNSEKLSAPANKEPLPMLASKSKTLQPTQSNILSQPTFDTVSQPDETVSIASAPVQQQDSLPKILSRKVSGISIAPTIFSGKVVDEKNQPMAGVTVEAADKSITVVTDNDGNFSLWKSDTTLKATAGTVGYITNTINLEPGDDNLIKLSQSNTALNEVVVVGYGTAKKVNAASKEAQPVGGWQNFDSYVVSELNKDTTVKISDNQQGMVEMEFLVDNNGNPTDIRIIKPLDNIRNAKAVEILKNGPRWTTTSKKKKAKVSISF